MRYPIEYTVARRLYTTERERGSRMSRPAVRVALAGVIIGVMVMLLTVFIAIGFKRAVSEKVSAIAGNVRVVNYDRNQTYELQPIWATDTLMGKILSVTGVSYAEQFITKPAMLKTDESFEGVVMKGYSLPEQSLHGAWAFFASNLQKGRLPEKENEILVSTTTARRLSLDTDSAIYCYFIQDNCRVRKLLISGLYETGFDEADRNFVICDLTLLQRLNGWQTDQVSGVEIGVTDFGKLDETTDKIYFKTGNIPDRDGNFYDTQNVKMLYPAIFAWLALLDMDVWVIILLMMAVSGFNIVSGLLILILDHITLIGTLKSLGANNRFVRRIFLFEATFLLGKGLLWGNIIGLTLAAIQYFLHIVPLDPATYYVSYVPICFHWGWWAALNAGTLVVSLLILLAPSAIVTRI